ncbi:MAG: hypothetical protein C0425_04510 [Chlorobiaceae bacterium]|nr:hypothetical protein [Chlorobiaceae bacterium]MBA4309578.1 hypothetical protein [Chlorobiaceae bacterium]
MKTLILILLLSFTIGNTFSQEDSFYFESKRNNGVFVVEPIYKLTQLNDQSASLIGLKLDWVLFNKYEMGAKLNYLKNNVITPTDFRFYPDSPEMELFYGGIEPGYKFPLSEKVSIYSSFFIGYGYASYNHISGTFDGKYFWIIEPSISIAYNIIDLIELKLGANYSNAFNINEIHYSTYSVGFAPSEYDIPIELNHLNFEVGLRFQLLRF